MKKLFYALLLLSGISGYSQAFSTSVGGVNFRVLKDDDSEKALGSMYVSNHFQPAKVNDEQEMVSLRYNAYRDEMEFRKDDAIYYLIKNHSTVVEFKHPDKTYVVASYFNKDNNLKSGYLEQLTKNVARTLYKKETITYRPAMGTITGYEKPKPAEFKRLADKYFINLGDKIVEMPESKKGVAKLFPGKEKEVGEYFKKNKVSFSNEADLINLVTFLSTL